MNDDILAAGVRAFEAGIPRKACPHPPHSRESEIWLAVWDEAISVAEEETESV